MVASCLLLGASQGFNASTGINIIAANFLLPLGVCVYTATGGLKATFLSDWIHTVIIYLVVLALCFKVFCTSDIIGSPGKMWDMLQESEAKFQFSTDYLSFKNKDMFMITWAVLIGGLSSVFGDPSYGQKAIAASPNGVLSGYILGGLCWLTIPWALGTAGGLAARALLVYPGFQTYPNALTSHEADAGLPVIYTFGAIMGQSGAKAAVLTLFMSVTSAMSAELIAFSSVATFDVYRGYINKQATGKQLVRFSHFSTAVFSLVVACVSIIFNYVGVSVGWLISFYGIILVPAAAVITYTLYWRKTSNFAVTYGPPLSTLMGLACWLGAAAAYGDNVVDKHTLMTAEASIIGNFATFGGAFLMIPVLSYWKPDPQPFDFAVYQNAFTAGDDADALEVKAMVNTEQEEKTLKRAAKVAIVFNIILIGGGYLIVPLALYGSDYSFSKGYFTSWVIIMMICLFLASLYIILFPIWQGRKAIKSLCLALLKKTPQVEDGDVLEAENSDTEMILEVNQEKT